ncbi:MAG: hypothetical protein M1816_005825 [Peltula sp. TS41687]|nr:MAG: hypothetical protein M1816_005825 [Peltula sp. TS41687]
MHHHSAAIPARTAQSLLQRYLDRTDTSAWLHPDASLSGAVQSGGARGGLTLHNLRRVEAGLRGERLGAELSLEDGYGDNYNYDAIKEGEEEDVDGSRRRMTATEEEEEEEEGWQDMEEFRRGQDVEEGELGERIAGGEGGEVPVVVLEGGEEEEEGKGRVVDRESRKREKKERRKVERRERNEMRGGG